MGEMSGGINRSIDRALELLVVWMLATSALGLVSALAGHFLVPQVLLCGVFLTVIYAWRKKGGRPASGALPDWRHLVLLTLVCLFFRVPAYHYVLGGQDEGVYVNMAHYIAQTGGVEVRDVPLEKLVGSPLAKIYLDDNRGSAYLPGVYVFNKSDARLEFQFYHLFPVWMALFAGLLGSASGVYALNFFAWLSVIFLYRLALVVSDSRRTALLAGMLLALNPLHAFFSKFPVTETVALAFSLIGFTYLAIFRKEDEGSRHHRWLWISVASFGCLFATRISGFMYMPFLIALVAASSIGDSDRPLRKAMCAWGLALTGLYALSVWYGLHWSGHYSRDIYRLSFERLFHHKWHAGVAVAVVLILGAWLAVVFLSRSDRRRNQMSRYIVMPARQALGGIVALAMLAGLVRIYQLGWTDHFLHDRWLGERWHLAHAAWRSAEASSLFALLVYLGLLLPAGVYLLVARRQNNPSVEFLRFFVSGFLGYAVLLQWTVPYGPYYARYLLSEVVPYLGLFVVLAWSGMRLGIWKQVVGSLLGISLLYMAYASAAQLGKIENDGLYGSLKQLLAPVDSSDLVLMTSLGPGWPVRSQIKTPIVYTFGRHVINVSDESLRDHGYVAALNARYADVFLLSTSPSAPREFALVDSTQVVIRAFERSYFYPSEFKASTSKRLYLYRMMWSLFPLSQVQRFDGDGSWGHFLVTGWSTPENWGTWSQGLHAQLVMDTRELPHPEHGVRLHFEANVLVNPAHRHQRIAVSLDGVAVAQRDVVYPQSSLAFDVVVSPNLLSSARKVHIDFDLPDAVTPQSIGLGNDTRMIALGLRSLEVYPLTTSESAESSDRPDLPTMENNPSAQVFQGL